MGLSITERKLAAEALRASEERFRATFEQAAVGMAHVATDGRFLLVNDKLCRILGYSRQELLGTTYLDLTLPEDRTSGVEEVALSLRDGGPLTATLTRSLFVSDSTC